MLNRVVLIGRLANDPELKYTPSGIAVSSFRLAVDRPFTNANGERETDFIDIVVWRQSAEFAANYLGKGRLVAVDGRLQIRTWVAQDGTRRRSAEVVADTLRGLDRPREQGQGAPGDRAPAGGFEQTPAAVGAISDMANGEDPDAFNDPFADQ
jgi:single-strand DNA-binding protein